METFDLAVLGLGGMGSAAAWAAARRGASVCGFEQFGMAHNLGSSHGDVRVIRKAYFEHPDYVPLLHEAYEKWDEIEQHSGKKLLVISGILMTGAAESETMQGLHRCYASNRLPHERLDAETLRRRFPLFHLPEHHEGFFDPSGGYLFVEDCVTELCLAAQAHGAQLHLHEAVVGWEATPEGVRVVTDQRTIEAKSIVITLGPWSGGTLPGLDLPLQVVRKVQLWYRFDEMESYVPPAAPVFFHELEYGNVYGFPVYGADGLKLAVHDGGQPVAGPETLDRGLQPDDESIPRRFLAETFPSITPHRSRFSVCMYTSTPDEHFILDQHPEHPQVCFAAGFSGHGFKFASIIGEIMADLALEGRTTRPIDFLRASRFDDRP